MCTFCTAGGLSTRPTPVITDPNLIIVQLVGSAPDDDGPETFLAFRLDRHVGPNFNHTGTRGHIFRTVLHRWIVAQRSIGMRVELRTPRLDPVYCVVFTDQDDSRTQTQRVCTDLPEARGLAARHQPYPSTRAEIHRTTHRPGQLELVEPLGQHTS